jgi:hypothetical protein
MASGDAQRAWFPEMLDDLENRWSSKMTWDDLAVFCRSMTEKRKRIRDARGIQAPRVRCGKCGGTMVLPPISIRSALFSLRKLGIIDDERFKKLDRDWIKHRKQNALDAYGNKSKS